MTEWLFVHNFEVYREVMEDPGLFSGSMMMFPGYTQFGGSLSAADESWGTDWKVEPVPHDLELESHATTSASSAKGKKTAQRHSVYSSAKTHSKILPCKYCDATFFSYSGLRKHTKSIHLQEYPFNCEVCGKGFFGCERLGDHMNMHQNIKTHECPICYRMFTFKSLLRQHISRGTCHKKIITPTVTDNQ